MKILLILLLALPQISSAQILSPFRIAMWASQAQNQYQETVNDLRDRLADKKWFTNGAISSILRNRCRQYSNLISRDQIQCDQAVETFISEMDMGFFIDYSKYTNPETGEQSKSTIAGAMIFKKEFLSLIQSKSIQNILISLRSNLLQRRVQEREFNVWKFVLDEFKGDRSRTIAFMAVIFQDITSNSATLTFLQTKYPTLAKKPVFTTLSDIFTLLAVEEVDSFRFRLESILMMDAKYSSQYNGIIDSLDTKKQATLISLLPLEFPDQTKGYRASTTLLNTSIYHFYVTAYIASKMNRHFQFSGASTSLKRFSAFIPFMFNAVYEFTFINSRNRESSNQPYQSMVIGLNDFIRDPKSISIQKHDWSLKDIYAGYLGSLFGTNSTQFVSYNEFQNRMSRNPSQFMEEILDGLQ